MSLGLFRAITKLLPHPVLLCTASGRILAVNPAAARQHPGLRSGADLLACTEADAVRPQLERWCGSGSPLPGSLTLIDATGRRRRFRCHGGRAVWWEGPEAAVQLHLNQLTQTDQFVVLNQQLTALNREVAYRRAAETERERLFLVEQQQRTLMQNLYGLTSALAVAASLAEVVEAVDATAPAALGARAVHLELHSERLVPSLSPAEGLRALAGVVWTDLDRGPARKEKGREKREAEGAQRQGTAQEPQRQRPRGGRSGKPGGPDGDGDHTRVVLSADGLLLGYLLVRYGPDGLTDHDNLNAVAQQISQALRRAGLHEHEHRIAERLQRSLLPALPPVPGIGVASRYAPGSDLVDVGGDWYDLYVLDENRVGISMGDVAGHGLPEATAMGQICAALRSIALHDGDRPAKVLEQLNTFLDTYMPGRMATACYLVYDRRTGTLRYSKAGHPPPLLIGADGTCRYLDDALAPPLGPIADVQRPEAEIPVRDGDTLLLYTDGLIERRDEPLDAGLSRLVGVAPSTVGQTVDDLCDTYLHHGPDTEYPDDRALLALRFAVPGVPEPLGQGVLLPSEEAGAASAV